MFESRRARGFDSAKSLPFREDVTIMSVLEFVIRFDDLIENI